MRPARDVGMGTRVGGMLMAVSLGTLAMTAVVDFVVWPLILGRTDTVSVNVVAVVLGFGCAVAFSAVASVFFARRLGRTMAKLEGAARQVADGRSGVRVAPVALGPEADGLVAAFNEMAVQLDSSDQSRRRLLADLAHEIRTPVSVLDGYLEGIADGVVDPDAATLAMLRTQTTRLARLTDDVLSVSHAEEGALNLRPSAVDVAEVLEAAAAAARRAYADKGVRLHVRIGAGARRSIRADRQRLDQVLANLLSNAVRHSDPGGAVELEADGHPHRRIRIAVVDHGDGIAPEHLPWIFERFYRTDVARDRDHGGSGVGLTISRALVAAHDGHMWVESDGPGRGATFAFTLPAP
ncbi:sensor histidine kinase [Tsukamurella ocularis]|uniref:sensor histidine kinase n=1 Tax=Tsukamurella ocularis TaxID=1970234 RepID=UPI0039EE37D6